jgi:hypothetical protein
MRQKVSSLLCIVLVSNRFMIDSPAQDEPDEVKDNDDRPIVEDVAAEDGNVPENAAEEPTVAEPVKDDAVEEATITEPAKDSIEVSDDSEPTHDTGQLAPYQSVLRIY